MFKGSNTYTKPDDSRVGEPTSTQDTIEIQAIAEDGIFRVQDKLYTKLYRFADVNYSMQSEDEQIDFIYRYLKVLSTLSVRWKLLVQNKKRDEEEFKKQVYIQLQGDRLDTLREDMNQIYEARLQEGRRGIEQELLLVLAVEREGYEAAKSYFITLENILSKGFTSLGSAIEPLRCYDRLKLLYDFYQSGSVHGVSFVFDFDQEVESGRDFLNDIAPEELTFHENYAVMGNQFLRALCLQSLPSQLGNDFLRLLVETSVRMTIALDVRPMPKKFVSDMLQSKYMAVEEKIRKQQQRRNKNQDYASEISYVVQEEKADIAEIMKQVKEQDMALSYAGLTILLQADTKEELEQATETVKSIAKGESVVLSDMSMQQREGINTALPIGVCQTSVMRTMTSADLTAFLPFNTQELSEEDGICYGVNQNSKNLVLGNRRRLKNGNGWIFGATGAGKSVQAKSEIIQNLLHSYGASKNEVVIIDPNNEYAPLVPIFSGQYVDIRPATKHKINGLAIPSYVPRTEITANKVGWMTGMLEQVAGRSLIAQEKSVCERALRMLYAPYENGAIKASDHQPTMTEYRQILLSMTDESIRDIAQDMALSLELFTEGTLNMFGGEENIDLDAPLLVYGFRDIPKDIWSLAMFVIMESLKQRVYQNYQRGVATWIYFDEAHELLKMPQSADYIDVIWREFRKFYGFCTGITHEVSDTCKNEKSKALINLSDFTVIFAQNDTTTIREIYHLTDAQLKFIEHADAGHGLLRHGKTIIPVDNTIPKGSKVYEILNTDPDKFVQKG